MAKRKKQHKQRLTVGRLVVILLLLWAVGAGIWRHYDLPLPDSLAEEIETAEKLAGEKLGRVRAALESRLASLFEKPEEEPETPEKSAAVTLDTLPDYDGIPYVELYDNQPSFTEEEKAGTVSWERYAELDWLGRCGAAMACIGQDLMPTEERGAIGMVKPSGWHTVRYDDVVDGKYLYNRCHLIGYQLTGENANEQNLITGTRYLNVVGMLPFEDQTADYVKETGNHVLYRVTPVFKGLELVARGVQMEAWSVEDGGTGVCFNVYCYNVQPGVEIDYATGESRLAEEGAS